MSENITPLSDWLRASAEKMDHFASHAVKNGKSFDAGLMRRADKRITALEGAIRAIIECAGDDTAAFRARIRDIRRLAAEALGEG